MDNEIMDRLKNFVRQDAKFKFSNLEVYPDFFSVETCFTFKGEERKFLTVVGLIGIYLDLIEEIGVSIQKDLFKELVNAFIEILFKHTDIKQDMEVMEVITMHNFLVTNAVGAVAVESLVQTKLYKLHCLYDEKIKILTKAV
jgi:hypothetical protein